MMPSKIVVDLSFLRLGPCGLSEYAYQFGKHIIEQHNPREFDITFLVPVDHPFPKQSVVKYKEISFWDRYVKQWVNRFDLYHTTSFPSPFMPISSRFKGKLVATLHDLNFVYEKSDSKIDRYMRYYRDSLSRVDRLICISNYVMGDLKKYLKPIIPVSVIYNGVAVDQEIIENTMNPFPYQDNFPYLLSISTFMKKKNLDKLISMMLYLPNYKLIIAGKVIHKDYYEEVRQKVKEIKLEERIIFMGEVSDEQKYRLYKNCTAYVFPSIAEGFGIPPIEAMLYGKPVFVSHRTSIPEICGEYAFYWIDFDPESMARVFKKGMEIYQSDSNYSCKLKQFATRYSWKVNVENYLQVYRDVLKL